MDVSKRREQILQILENSTEPISGSMLSKTCQVSRQIIVGDIAVLRANGNPIVSTCQGYVLQQPHFVSRVYKVHHTNEQVAEELNLIVDLGGSVDDVFVYHKVYGVMKADMSIHSRKDVDDFMEKIISGKSSLLLNITSGYHYHTVSAEKEETLDFIFHALDDHGFLAPLQDYEPVHF